MTTRVGIELSPVACRIVDIQVGAGRGAQLESRVTSFASLAWSDAAVGARLAALRRLPVAVVAWGARSWHQQVEVADGRYEAMRAEAVASLTGASAFAPRRVSDIAPAGPRSDGALLRPVVVAAADASGVRAALRPLVKARVRAQSLVTPAVALMSLARLRRATTRPGVLNVYVALEETATAIALVRNGALVAARELAWGFLDPARPRPAARPRQAIGAALAAEIAALARDEKSGALAQVCICGALGDLRFDLGAAHRAAGRRSRHARFAVRRRRHRPARAGGPFPRVGRRVADGVGGRRGRGRADQPAAAGGAPRQARHDGARGRRGGRRRGPEPRLAGRARARLGRAAAKADRAPTRGERAHVVAGASRTARGERAHVVASASRTALGERAARRRRRASRRPRRAGARARGRAPNRSTPSSARFWTAPTAGLR